MSGTTGTIPTAPFVDDELLTKELLNGEFDTVGALMDAAGCGGHSDIDADMQIQTNPYPGSVLSKPTSIAGELERLRYVVAAILGKTYWYQPAASGNSLASVFVTGEIRPYGGASIPTGFLECDGSSVLRTTYADLFTAIGTTWGSADGTHFTLPDLRGRTLLGAGTGSGLTARSLGQTGGEETHLLTTAELPPLTHNVTDAGHIHAVTDPGHTHAIKSNGSGSGFPTITAADGSGVTHTSNSNTTGVSVNSHTTGITVADTNGNGAHNNMQPWACVKWMIKT